MKTYIANTPLILEDAAGREFRVERGDTVALTPEQYRLVAAHVREAGETAATDTNAAAEATPAPKPPKGGGKAAKE